MGTKKHAKCDYCGATESEDWIIGDHQIYCSWECKMANDMWVCPCCLFIIVPMTVSVWFSFGWSSFMTPIYIFSILFSIALVIMTIRGIQAKNRVSQRLRHSGIDIEEMD